jgi:hypothetical protein
MSANITAVLSGNVARIFCLKRAAPPKTKKKRV